MSLLSFISVWCYSGYSWAAPPGEFLRQNRRVQLVRVDPRCGAGSVRSPRWTARESEFPSNWRTHNCSLPPVETVDFIPWNYLTISSHYNPVYFWQHWRRNDVTNWCFNFLNSLRRSRPMSFLWSIQNPSSNFELQMDQSPETPVTSQALQVLSVVKLQNFQPDAFNGSCDNALSIS